MQPVDESLRSDTADKGQIISTICDAVSGGRI